MDCLVNVIRRVGMESLILDVPFVCKSWYKATLNPLCWQKLHVPLISFPPSVHGMICLDTPRSRLENECHINGDSCANAFITFVVKRSDRSATSIVLPPCCTEKTLLFIVDESPNLRVLVLREYPGHDLTSKFPNLLSKWKHLEFLSITSRCINCSMEELLSQIKIHCKAFSGLAVKGGAIEEKEAIAIVTLVPNIKYLDLSSSDIEQENLLIILKGCKELVHFDVRYCQGFEEGDEEILKLASHITTFKDEGSSLSNFGRFFRHLAMFRGTKDVQCDCEVVQVVEEVLKKLDHRKSK